MEARGGEGVGRSELNGCSNQTKLQLEVQTYLGFLVRDGWGVLSFFASPFLEVISQLSQAFLPTYSVMPERADRSSWRAASDGLVVRLEKLGLLVGSLIAGTVGSIVAFAPGIVTRDAAVQTAAKPLAAILASAVLLTGPVAVSEGTLIARSELSFLAGVYLFSTALLPPVLRKIRAGGGPVSQVWICFALFQLFRSLCFAGRLLLSDKRTDGDD